MSSSTAPISVAEEKTISVRTNDGRIFTVPRKVVAVSFKISGILRDLGVDEYTDFTEEIPLPDVSGPIFEKIVEWCVYHMDDPPYVHLDPREQRMDDIPQWDKDFLNVEQPILFEIVTAANNLDIKPLLNTCCKIIAKSLRGAPVDQLMATFNIESPFTPEEMEQLRGENLWCVDEDD